MAQRHIKAVAGGDGCEARACRRIRHLPKGIGAPGNEAAITAQRHISVVRDRDRGEVRACRRTRHLPILSSPQETRLPSLRSATLA